YVKARRGEIRDFTGISAPYEAPIAAELTIDTSQGTLSTQVAAIIQYLIERGVMQGAGR
ncbi:MAG: adenylyl-sulfate kinase, partial [Shewanella sp.]